MYSLRPATDDDYDFLYRLHAAAIRPSVEATWGWEESWQKEYFRRKWDPTHRRVIQVDGADVGVVVVEPKEGEIYVALLEILPSHQRRGIGTAVLQNILATAAEQKLPVTLHVLKTNTLARRLYERLGFTVVAEEEVRYKMRYLP